MPKLSDQDRLWYERSPEKQPAAPYEYPTDGYEIVELRRGMSATLYQINDYRSRRKLYLVVSDVEIITTTLSRSAADTSFSYAEECANAGYREIYSGVQTAV